MIKIAVKTAAKTAAITAAIAGLVALVASGCAANGTYKTARPLGKGTTQFMVAPQVSAAGDREGDKIPFPEIAFGARHGLTSKLDVGGTLAVLPLGRFGYSVAIEATAKQHLYRYGRLERAIGAAAGYRTIESSGAIFESIHATLPLIAGINLGRHQLIVSPTLAWQRWYSQSARPLDVPSLGSSLGFHWQLSQRFALLPEVSWSYSPLKRDTTDETILLHTGIALVYSR